MQERKKEAIATHTYFFSSNSPTLAPHHALKQLCTRLYDTSAIMQLAAMDLARSFRLLAW
jgi:hypothetical protein